MLFKKNIIFFLVLLIISAINCSLEKKVPEQEKKEEEVVLKEEEKIDSSRLFIVKRLSEGKTITIGDKSLKEWNESFLVFSISDSNAGELQWHDIRGVPRKKLALNDIDIKIYMATDGFAWYLGIAIKDDKIITSPARKPYGGDCVELFFAGVYNNKEDMHNYVDYNDKVMFQLEIPAKSGEGEVDYFPSYRTGRSLKALLKKGTKISTWIKGKEWRSEASIPLSYFHKRVCQRIKNHQTLKFNMDYLDYDIKAGEYGVNYGFSPDNVFSLDQEEICVNTPYYMRSILFE